eukprot:1716372-Alexandrium_andersonii.AAC.1
MESPGSSIVASVTERDYSPMGSEVTNVSSAAAFGQRAGPVAAAPVAGSAPGSVSRPASAGVRRTLVPEAVRGEPSRNWDNISADDQPSHQSIEEIVEGRNPAEPADRDEDMGDEEKSISSDRA